MQSLAQEGAVGQQTLTELPILAGLPGSPVEGRTHIHIAGYFNCSALKPELPGILKLIKDKHPEITISLDTNYDSSETWNVDALLPYIDIFMPNEVCVGGCHPADMQLRARRVVMSLRCCLNVRMYPTGRGYVDIAH